MVHDMDARELVCKLKELVEKLEQITPENDPVEYEDALRICVEEVQSTTKINMRLSGLHNNEAETLVKVLELADVSNLKELDFSRTFITDSVVHSLAEVLGSGRFSALETLDLSHNIKCRMYMDSSKALAQVLETGSLSRLRVLGLPSCHVPTIALAMLKGNMLRLEELHLQFNRDLMQSNFELRNFFEKGVLSELKVLNLRECFVTDDQIEQLTKKIRSRELVKLEHLNLSYNSLGQEGCLSLSRAIRCGHLRSLKFLDLNGCHVGDGGLRQILDWIDKTPLLEFLNLKNNAITDSGIATLAQVMKAKNLLRMREIRLSGRNMITNQGIVALANVLADPKCVPNLRILDLGAHRTLEYIGARAVANAYRQNPNLTVFVEVSWPSESLNLRTQEQRRKNKRAEEITTGLKDEELVAQTTAKVFLCGYERVGKTTLRNSLERSKLESLVKWERRPRHHETPRTRGIELSHITGEHGSHSEKITLMLWDLAGQQEFHVMHGTLLPDLGLASGKATTFVLVFRVDIGVNPSTERKEELLYWLRFITAGSVKGTKRHLVLVLNCIDSQNNGGVASYGKEILIWKHFLNEFSVMFSDVIDIHLEPFVIDARSRTSVKELKQHLMEYVATALSVIKIPKVCLDIRDSLVEWVKENSQFPVLGWSDFSDRMGKRGIGLNKLEAAAAHLQESGWIIYYWGPPADVNHVDSDHGGFVIADPEWFCRRVIGQLLLPKHMLDEGEPRVQDVGEDGSLEQSLLTLFFSRSGLVTNDRQVKTLLCMLGTLGLCYKVGTEKVFIPALIQKDDLTMWEKTGRSTTQQHWVMGRSLRPKKEEKGMIPSSVFRKMQVLLAQDKRFGLRTDSMYCAGKTFSSFMVESLIVLVQFDVDESDPADDRIDVLVKHLVEPKETEVGAEVELILQIMDMVERLCIQSCPGVDLERLVIRPWYAKDPTFQMAKRDVMLVEELKKRVLQHGLGKYTSWTVGHQEREVVREDQLLSMSELEAIQSCVQQRLHIAMADIENFGLLPLSPKDDEEQGEEDERNKQDETLSDVDRVIAVVREEGKKTRDHIDKRMAELHEKFDKVFEQQTNLLNQILGLNRFSIQEKQRSNPRFIYFAKHGEPSVFITVRQAFHEKFQLHLLCEASYDSGIPHIVEGQQGLQISSTREWLRRVSPWLMWSLKVTIVVARIVGGFFAPGIGVLLPDFDGGDSNKLAESVEKMAMEVNADLRKDGTLSPRGTVEQISQAVMTQLIRDVGRVAFYEKTSLRRVALSQKESPSLHSSVVWICPPCFSSYGRDGRVTDITPFQ